MLNPFKKIKSLISLVLFRIKWRRNNRHNYTAVKNVFKMNKVKVGKYTYGELNVLSWRGDYEYLEIGNFCSIAGDVKILLGGNHTMDAISTYPFKGIFLGELEAKSKGPIIIEDDV